MPTIRIDMEVAARLTALKKGNESYTNVLRRLLGLPLEPYTRKGEGSGRKA
jgi:predicted CopG family antitoxin